MCSLYLIEAMEYVVGRMFVQKYFDSNSKKLATEMIVNIKNEFTRMLKEVDWMDDESRSSALDKVIDCINLKKKNRKKN